MRTLVGNDIVDLLTPYALDKCKNQRYVRRVLTAHEISLMEESSSPSLFFWSLWAAKEAAYKVMKKLEPSTVFSHSAFEVQRLSQVEGVLLFGETHKFNLKLSINDNWVHCVALLASEHPMNQVHSYILRIDEINTKDVNFSDDELASIHSPESAAVRTLTKNLLRELGEDGIEIIRPPKLNGFFPPELYRGAVPLKGWDVSLSHDGDYVACSLSFKS